MCFSCHECYESAVTHNCLKEGQMAKVTFVLGGARSGKSAHAEALAMSTDGSTRLVYVATAQIFDDEMESRVALHRDRRGPEWDLVEAPTDLPAAISANGAAGNVLLIDCLSVWATNLLVHEHDTDAARQALIAAIGASEARIILVASETGLGIVPDNRLSRRFRDINGLQNQAVAAIADEVFFMAAGLALRLKPPQ